MTTPPSPSTPPICSRPITARTAWGGRGAGVPAPRGRAQPADARSLRRDDRKADARRTPRQVGSPGPGPPVRAAQPLGCVEHYARPGPHAGDLPGNHRRAIEICGQVSIPPGFVRTEDERRQESRRRPEEDEMAQYLLTVVEP